MLAVNQEKGFDLVQGKNVQILPEGWRFNIVDLHVSNFSWNFTKQLLACRSPLKGGLENLKKLGQFYPVNAGL